MLKKTLNNNNTTLTGYSTDLTLTQSVLTMVNFDGALSRLRKYSPVEIINSIAYVVKTGCQNTINDIDGMIPECVKSNFGTPDFIPIQGRWVVERTISWMENYRRLTRNYERLLKVTQQMFLAGCVFFMLRYFARA